MGEGSSEMYCTHLVDGLYLTVEGSELKDLWYGDKRDIVIWGVPLHLADIYLVERILQVVYFRPNEWNNIEIDGQEYPIPEYV